MTRVPAARAPMPTRVIRLGLMVLVVIGLAVVAPVSATTSYRIDRVIDGDTVELRLRLGRDLLATPGRVAEDGLYKREQLLDVVAV